MIRRRDQPGKTLPTIETQPPETRSLRRVDPETPAKAPVSGSSETVSWQVEAAELARRPRPSPPETTGPILRRIEQFVLLERLGAGGMGVVYAAFDERLERKVAIKLVATDRGNDQAQQRLLREAQAQARLSHPNVVTIYEVGTLPEDGLFIAMELVKGQTLRDWQSSPQRWQDIVAMYAAAGEGLAAAHRAGIIHRDFKPDNILVGEDRVRVADFGLALEAHTPLDASLLDTMPDSETRAATSSDGRSSSAKPALTAAGAITGTPGYLAPEVFTGAIADARTDQFSFCAALYEALHGERPYADFAFISETPEPRRTEPDPAYPRWLWDVITRGLALDPDARFASMDALLGELTRNRARNRRVLAGVALVSVLAVGTTAAALTRHDAPPACPRDPAALAGAWDPTIKRSVETAVLATAVPFAANVWTSTSAAFDRYAERWIDAQQAACAATHVHHVQSATLLDRRMECLAGRRRALAAAAEAMHSRPAQAVGHANEILASLGDIELCADTGVLLNLAAGVAPTGHNPAGWPIAAHTQSLIDNVRARLARADVLLATGDVAGATPVVREAANQASGIEDDGLRAEVAYFEGRIKLLHGELAEALIRFHRAVDLAVASHHDELPADIWLKLAITAGGLEQRPAEIETWLGQAESWLRRLNHPSDSRRIEAERARAFLQGANGDTRAAEATLTSAIAAGEQLWGREDPRLAPLLRNRATARGLLHDAKPAVADAERAYALGLAAWGPEYPEVVAIRRALGMLYLEQLGDVARAEHELTAALALYRAQLGDDSIDVATCEQGLSEAGQYRGDYVAALQHAERAEQIMTRRLGPDNLRRGEALQNIGVLRFLSKDLIGSLSAYEAAYPIMRAALGPNHTKVGLLLSNTGETLLALGRYDAAQENFTQALEALRTSLGPGHIYLAFPLKGLGLTHLSHNQPAEAVVPLEDALALHLQAGAAGVPTEIAEIRWGLAQALTVLHRDPARAHALATAALASYRGLGNQSTDRVREISRWLATHAAP